MSTTLVKHDGQWYDFLGNQRYVDEFLSDAPEGAMVTIDARPKAQLELFEGLLAQDDELHGADDELSETD